MKIKKPVVLIVDDDEIFTWINKKVLKSENSCVEVDICNNGKQALRFFDINAEQPNMLPDILLLDINMPIMDGWEFLEHFEDTRHKLAKLPLIWILSSSILPEEIERGNKNPLVRGYISKPFLKEDAEKVLQEAEEKCECTS